MRFIDNPEGFRLFDYNKQTKAFERRPAFQRYQREVEFGRRLRRIKIPVRNPYSWAAQLALDGVGWYLENQEGPGGVPDPGALRPNEVPYNFDEANWTLYDWSKEEVLPNYTVEVPDFWYADDFPNHGLWTNPYNTPLVLPPALTYPLTSDIYEVGMTDVWRYDHPDEVNFPDDYGYVFVPHKHWHRIAPNALPADQLVWTGPVTAPQVAVPRIMPQKFHMPNPNVVRRTAQPSTKQPTGLVRDPTRFVAQSFERVVAVSSSSNIGTVTTGRAPPAAGERERKFISRTAKAGIELSRALGKLSEGADLVDAVYEALPDDVKKRWGKGRKDRPIDNWGQYGISGADWKLQAIYHNYHKLDFSEAAKNILLNELEDQAYGRAYGARDKLRPRNLGKFNFNER